MNTQTPYYHYAQQEVARRRRKMAVIMAHRQKRDAAFAAIRAHHQWRRAQFVATIAAEQHPTVTAVNVPATAAAIPDHQSSVTRATSGNGAPPKSAEYLLYLFLSREDRLAMFGDLEEEYWTDVLPKFGAPRARLWFWKEVVRSVLPTVSRSIANIACWLITRFTS